MEDKYADYSLHLQRRASPLFLNDHRWPQTIDIRYMLLKKKKISSEVI